MKIDSMKAPDGYVYLVIVPNHWGKGKTLKEAFANVRKSGGDTDGNFQIFLTDPKAYVDEMGNSIERPKDGKASVMIGLRKEVTEIFHAH